MTYDSAQAQSVRVTKNIFWFCWLPLSRHYKKWG